jgi:hypothetical protein
MTTSGTGSGWARWNLPAIREGRTVTAGSATTREVTIDLRGRA